MAHTMTQKTFLPILAYHLRFSVIVFFGIFTVVYHELFILQYFLLLFGTKNIIRIYANQAFYASLISGKSMNAKCCPLSFVFIKIS
jgi:hypothetical protein